MGGASVAGMRPPFQPPSFASLDSNSDKSITLDELKANAPGGASAAGDKRAEALFKAIDADGDGSITEQEKSSFDQKLQDRQAGIAFLAQQLSGPSNADVFAATDADGDGAVSFDEFADDDAAKGVDEDGLKAVFDLIDADGDGAISETESSDFLDQVKTALAEQKPPPPSGGQMGGPPPPPPPDSENGASADLLSMAQNAYAKSNSSDLLSTLQTLLKQAA
jgi:Ca2+-binding EF-hand superfamily protein